MTGPALTVVIPTLGRPEQLHGALASLAASRLQPAEVLVVDGDATGAAAPVAAAHAGGALAVRHLRAPRGLTRQRNVGLDAASGQVVLFLDDDARVLPDTLERLIAAYADPQVVGATGRVVEPASNRVGGKSSRLRLVLRGRGRDGTFTRSGYPRRLIDETVDADVEFMQGAFLSARTAVARQVRFDERLTGYGLLEDEDFSCRLARRGRVRYVAAAVVEHDNAGFGGRDRRAFGHQVVRNRAYLFAKNFPQTPSARRRFRGLLLLLVVHRLLNRDAAGALGVAQAALRRPDPPRPYGED